MAEFISLVRDMRKAQRDYFKTRSKDNLKKSIALEKKVDKWLNADNGRDNMKGYEVPDFTPGPWKIDSTDTLQIRSAVPYDDPTYISGLYVLGETDTCNIACLYSDGKNDPVAEANARLIAEAPKMYELLNEAFTVLAKHSLDEPLRLEIDVCLCHIEKYPVPGEDEEDD